MSASQNGWTVHDTTDGLIRINVAGRGWWCANNDIGTIFSWLIDTFNNTVESVTADDKVPDDWSWALRNVRGSTSVISNHASATAIDINAVQHPRGEHGTFSSEQFIAIRSILGYLNKNSKCIRWGGDYIKSPIDSMHWEIICTPYVASLLADRIKKEMLLTEKNLKAIAEAVWADDTIPHPGDPKNATWRPDSVLQRIMDDVEKNKSDMAEIKADMAKVLAALKISS